MAKKKDKKASGPSLKSLQKQIAALASEQVKIYGLIIALRERVEKGP